MADKRPDAPETELTPEQKRGCAWALLLGIIGVIIFGLYLIDRDKKHDCEVRSCAEGRTPRLIDGECICVVLPGGDR
jgi:hypothetical protein